MAVLITLISLKGISENILTAAKDWNYRYLLRIVFVDLFLWLLKGRQFGNLNAIFHNT